MGYGPLPLVCMNGWTPTRQWNMIFSFVWKDSNIAITRLWKHYFLMSPLPSSGSSPRCFPFFPHQCSIQGPKEQAQCLVWHESEKKILVEHSVNSTNAGLEISNKVALVKSLSFFTDNIDSSTLGFYFYSFSRSSYEGGKRFYNDCRGDLRWLEVPTWIWSLG